MSTDKGAGNRSLFSFLMDEFRARRAERELLSMDDRSLADIGLTRSDIPAAVRHRGFRVVAAEVDANLSGVRGFRAA